MATLSPPTGSSFTPTAGISNFVIKAPTPVHYYQTSDGGFTVVPPSLQPTASAPANAPAGTNPSDFQTLAQLWAASFGQPASQAGAATGDGPYVIASQGSAPASSGSTPNPTAIIVLVALAIGGYFLYRRMKS